MRAFTPSHIQERRIIKTFQVALLSSSENLLYIIEDKDMQEERSEANANEKEEMQKNKRIKLSCDLAKIYPSAFRNWPILNLLKPEFTMQIRMVMVYDNGNRALIETQDMNVYTIDYNKDDHLKTGDTHIGLYPKKMKELCGINIQTFACNSYFVLALPVWGKVYSWRFNQKSISDSSSYLPEMPSMPTQVLSLPHNIVDIACGNFHSLALTDDGRVYAWGDNNYGQIGVEVKQIDATSRNRGINFISEPRLNDKLKKKKVICIACGSKFNIVVTDGGKLYGWGDNQSGQIDYQAKVKQLNKLFYSSPFEININNKSIVKVACGFQHSLALTNEGKIYAWGNNDKGQVGVNNSLEFSVPTIVDIPELVKDIAANGNMSVAVGSNKTVYVWGDCFGQNIIVPFLTGFSSIYDAFVYSTMRVMHEPLAVSNSDVEEVLNIFESLGLDIPGMEFDDPFIRFNVHTGYIFLHRL